MLELRDPELEVLELLAAGETSLLERPVDHLVSPRPQPLGLCPPRGERVAHGATHCVPLDPHAPREVVGELVRDLRAEARETDAREQELRDGPRAFGARGAHAPILGSRRASVSARGRAAARCGVACVARASSRQTRPRALRPPRGPGRAARAEAPRAPARGPHR